MRKIRYLDNVVTLELDRDKCVGCGMCVTVCPHTVFAMNGPKAEMLDKDGCMECGACATNCPADAISVRSGVGCASGIIKGILTGKEAVCDCDDGCC